MRIIIILFMLSIINLASYTEERSFSVVSCATLDWPPYIINRENDRGYIYEIVDEAFRRSGYRADIRFYPWARAVAQVESGNIDVLLPEYFSSEREKTCLFSDPVPGGPAGLMKRRDLDVQWPFNPVTEPEKALRALGDYKFGVVRGYINTEAFDRADYLKKDYAVSDELNIRKLYHKRVDFIFIDRNVADYIILKEHKLYSDTLEFMEPPMEEKELFLAFSKKAYGSLLKLEAFNKALSEMKSDGSLDKILIKYRIKE